jgi:hypothetical protein
MPQVDFILGQRQLVHGQVEYFWITAVLREDDERILESGRAVECGHDAGKVFGAVGEGNENREAVVGLEARARASKEDGNQC